MVINRSILAALFGGSMVSDSVDKQLSSKGNKRGMTPNSRKNLALVWKGNEPR